jgi:hypothetical protein
MNKTDKQEREELWGKLASFPKESFKNKVRLFVEDAFFHGQAKDCRTLANMCDDDQHFFGRIFSRELLSLAALSAAKGGQLSILRKLLWHNRVVLSQNHYCEAIRHGHIFTALEVSRAVDVIHTCRTCKRMCDRGDTVWRMCAELFNLRPVWPE